ncbi:unnamed protein product [Camellia sinensis]
MNTHLLDSAKLPNQPKEPSKPTIANQAAKKRSQNFAQGLQRQPKKDLSRILRTEAAIKAIERKANSTKYNRLWPKAVLEALDDAIREHRWESALKGYSIFFVSNIGMSQDAKRTQSCWCCSASADSPKQASLLFEILRSDGLQPTLDVYTALVGAYGLSAGCIYIFDSINCCTKLHRFDLIEHILAEMSYLGIECTTVTYNTIIDGYGKAELFELMENSFTDMIESGTCLPDVFTFNSFIGAYGNSGKIKEMEKWFDEFQLMGIRPDIKTFNILIRSYGKAGMYEKMGSVMEFMRKRLYSPTIVTFNIVIESFGMAGNIEKMEEFFLKMKHQGMKPNSVTYCSLVSSYSKAGHLRKVDSIMRQVENSDVVLDTPFFNCIISAYGQAGDITKMGIIFSAISSRHSSLIFIALLFLWRLRHSSSSSSASASR